MVPARGMDLVAVLRKLSDTDVRKSLPAGSRRGLWILATVDVMAATWMHAAGEWLDTASTVTSVITLGGHHLLVFWLAALGFALLAGTAPVTGGFAEMNRVQAVLIAVAGAASAAALAGVISVVGLIVGVVLLVALLGLALLG